VKVAKAGSSRGVAGIPPVEANVGDPEITTKTLWNSLRRVGAQSCLPRRHRVKRPVPGSWWPAGTVPQWAAGACSAVVDASIRASRQRPYGAACGASALKAAGTGAIGSTA